MRRLQVFFVLILVILHLVSCQEPGNDESKEDSSTDDEKQFKETKEAKDDVKKRLQKLNKDKSSDDDDDDFGDLDEAEKKGNKRLEELESDSSSGFKEGKLDGKDGDDDEEGDDEGFEGLDEAEKEGNNRVEELEKDQKKKGGKKDGDDDGDGDDDDEGFEGLDEAEKEGNNRVEELEKDQKKKGGKKDGDDDGDEDEGFEGLDEAEKEGNNRVEELEKDQKKKGGKKDDDDDDDDEGFGGLDEAEKEGNKRLEELEEDEKQDEEDEKDENKQDDNSDDFGDLDEAEKQGNQRLEQLDGGDSGSGSGSEIPLDNFIHGDSSILTDEKKVNHVIHSLNRDKDQEDDADDDEDDDDEDDDDDDDEGDLDDDAQTPIEDSTMKDRKCGCWIGKLGSRKVYRMYGWVRQFALDRSDNKKRCKLLCSKKSKVDLNNGKKLCRLYKRNYIFQEGKIGCHYRLGSTWNSKDLARRSGKFCCKVYYKCKTKGSFYFKKVRQCVQLKCRGGPTCIPAGIFKSKYILYKGRAYEMLGKPKRRARSVDCYKMVRKGNGYVYTSNSGKVYAFKGSKY